MRKGAWLGLIGVGNHARTIVEAASGLVSDIFMFRRTQETEQRLKGVSFDGTIHFQPSVDRVCDVVDGIVYAGPPQFLPEYAERIGGRRPVLWEKPLGLTSHDSEKVFQYFRATHSQVAHQLRYHPAIQWLRGIVQSDELGAIREIHFTTFYWPKKKTFELGVLADLGSHFIDLAGHLLQSNPAEWEVTDVYLDREKDEKQARAGYKDPVTGAAVRIEIWPAQDPDSVSRELSVLASRDVSLNMASIARDGFPAHVWRAKLVGGGRKVFQSWEPVQPYRDLLTEFLSCARDGQGLRIGASLVDGHRTRIALDTAYQRAEISAPA